MSAAVSFAFLAGLLATVNPCGFAMLPSFLTLYLADSDGQRRTLLARTTEGLAVGTVLSAAFGGVFVLAGLIVSAGLRFVLDVVPWLALVIGVALTIVGVAMVLGRHVGFVPASRVSSASEGSGGYRRVALFGTTYAVASLSCTLAVFLVVVSQALAAGNPLQLLAVFAAYAAGSASLLLALSVSAALARGALAHGVRRLAPIVNRLSGALLVLSGIYLVAYWLPAIGNGRSTSTSWAARATDRISATLADFFAARTTSFAIVLAVGLLLGSALIARGSLRRAARKRIAAGKGVTVCGPRP